MDSWGFVAAGYGLTAAAILLYVASLYRRAARGRRRIRALREADTG